ncbi:unnamed protein product [Lota lota]
MSNMKAQSLTFLLLGLLCVGDLSLQSVVFSTEVLLLIDGLSPRPPEVQVLAGPQKGVLVCLVSGLRAGPVLISWRVYTAASGPPMRTPGPQLLWTQAHPTDTYRASSIWTRNKTDWSPSAWYCCGATQGPSVPRDRGTTPGPVLEDGAPDLGTCCRGGCQV